MTNPTITCDRFADLLSDYLERDVDESTRAQIEAHAASCNDDCGALLADLRKLRVDAANLPELTPSRDLWTGISERIQTPVVALSPAGRMIERSSGRQRRVSSRVWMGLAAAGLVAVTATVTHQITKRSLVPGPSQQVASVSPKTASGPSQTSTTPATPATPATLATLATLAVVDSTAGRAAAAPSAAAQTSLASNRPTAEQTYNEEISRLRTVVAQRRSQFDSATVAVIERNLGVIDQAIAQCKQALRKDPHSQFLMESLNGALDDKVQLLRTAAMLPTKA
jgi:hypothetical protein